MLTPQQIVDEIFNLKYNSRDSYDSFAHGFDRAITEVLDLIEENTGMVPAQKEE